MSHAVKRWRIVWAVLLVAIIIMWGLLFLQSQKTTLHFCGTSDRKRYRYRTARSQFSDRTRTPLFDFKHRRNKWAQGWDFAQRLLSSCARNPIVRSPRSSARTDSAGSKSSCKSFAQEKGTSLAKFG